MPPIRIGLIGLGRHGMRYATHLLEPLPSRRLTAVCRQNVPEGSAFAARHGLHFHSEYQALINNPEVDAVFIVTPPTLTLPIAREAIRARKPVLIEKPLAPTGAEAREIVEAARKAEVPIMTAQTLRYDPAIRALRQASSVVGKLNYVVLTNRLEPSPRKDDVSQGIQGRGVLLEIGIHVLDLVRFLTGDEVREVRCELDTAPSTTPETRAWIRLSTTKGLSCFIDVSRVSEGRVTRAEIVGEAGQLIADWTAHRLWHISEKTHTQEQAVSETPTIPLVISEFLTALIQNTPMPISGLDGQRAVEIADACYESALKGQTIHLSS